MKKIDEDEILEVNNSEEEDEDYIEEKKSPILHFILIGLIIGLLVALIFIVKTGLDRWNKGVLDTTDVSVINEEYNIEKLDYILPMSPSQLEGHEDDGITTVLCLGNGPLSDAFDTEQNLTYYIYQALGEESKVYNCGIQDTTVTALDTSINQNYPMDAFSFYWISTAIGADNMVMLSNMIDFMGDSAPDQVARAVNRLQAMDFDKIDVIMIMYDATDYMCNMRMEDADNETNIQTYAGALAAGIQLIQNRYPHIRIMVMSPTYAYYKDPFTGEISDSDLHKNEYGSLATYIIKQSDICYENSVSFIDNFYGTVNVKNADQYLSDNIHLNEAGRQLVAQRFIDALNYYNHD